MDSYVILPPTIITIILTINANQIAAGAFKYTDLSVVI